jgi:hypothetical protein
MRIGVSSRPLRRFAWAVLLCFVPACSDPAGPDPLTLVAVGSTTMTGTVGEGLPESLVVKVLNSAAQPVSGVAVQFAVTAGGGSVSPGSSTTNADGIAWAAWTLGTTAGPGAAEAHIAGGSRVQFASTARPGPPAMLEKMAGDEQSGPYGVVLEHPLQVRLVDRYGNPLAGQEVRFQPSAGMVVPSWPVTDSAGVAATYLRLPGQQTTFSIAARFGQLPAVTFVASAHPPAFDRVSSGVNQGCAITRDGYLYCWGDNGHGGHEGRLPFGPEFAAQAVREPMPIVGATTYAAVSIGGMVGCALTRDGDVLCWGEQSSGETGTGSPSAQPATVPVRIAGSRRYRMVQVGTSSACAIGLDDRTYCWGQNLWGEIGGTGYAHHSPRELPGDPGFAVVKPGAMHSCGLTPDGRAYCWGSNESGQLGTSGTLEVCSPFGDNVPCSLTPLPVAGELRFRAIYTGWRHTCAQTLQSQIYCWGRNDEGQLGDGTQVNRPAPVLSANGKRYDALRTFGRTSCGLTDAGEIECWGSHGSTFGAPAQSCEVVGQPGWSTPCAVSPVRLPIDLRFDRIELGNNLCGFSGDVLYCWGSNYKGSIGDGTEIDRRAPVRVRGQS